MAETRVSPLLLDLIKQSASISAKIDGLATSFAAQTQHISTLEARIVVMELHSTTTAGRYVTSEGPLAKKWNDFVDSYPLEAQKDFAELLSWSKGFRAKIGLWGIVYSAVVFGLIGWLFSIITRHWNLAG